MTVGGGFARVYYSILDDTKFETIYEDDHHLAAWLRLLIVADQMWPGHPPIPAGIRARSFRALVSVGLVDAMPKHCYRIHGLDAERQKRSDHASNAAASRWHRMGNAPGNARASDEHSPIHARDAHQAKPSPSLDQALPPDPLDNGHDERLDGPLAYSEVTLRYPNPGSDLHEWTVRLAQEHGAAVFQAALATEFTINRSAKDLLSRTESRLARAADQARPSKSRAEIEATRRELAAEDERRTRILSAGPMKPLRDLMPDVKLGKPS